MAALWTVEYVGGAIRVRVTGLRPMRRRIGMRFCVPMAGF
mgnify:CR=1 FL=1